MTGPDPGFARGEVTAITSTGVLVENVERSRAIIWPPGMRVWKEFFVPVDEIELGDTLSARGEPQSDGSLLARPQSAWVNIGIRNGTFESADTDHINVRGLGGLYVTPFYLSSALDVVHVDTGEPISGGIGRLAHGQLLGAVGIALADGSFRATRIWFNPTAN